MATVRWTGAAQDVRQVQTVTAANTWATGDTGTLTINNKSITVTIGSAVTTTDVAAALAAAVNAATYDTGLVGDETKNFGGREIPEFTEIMAESSGAVVTLRGRVPGVPFTLTVSENTAGTGTLSTAVTTAATGKNFLSNAANYSGGAVPSDNDTLVFAKGSVSALYALDHFRTNNIDLNVTITGDWTGQLGLPPVNANGYAEYRQRYFYYRGVLKSLEVTPGKSRQRGGGNLYIDLQDQTNVSVTITGARGQDSVTPSIFLAGADASTFSNTVVVTTGAVSIEPDDAATGSTKFFAAAAITIGVSNGSAADPVVWIGRNARLHKAASGLSQQSGVTYSYAATKSGSDECDCTIYGGTFSLEPNAAASDTADFAVHSNGTLLFGGALGSCGTIELFGGKLDCSLNTSPVTADKIVAYRGSTIYDPSGFVAAAVHFPGCRLSDVNATLGADRLLDITNPAVP